MPWADDAAARLAVISGSTAAAVKNAVPAFGGSRGQPVRAITACRLCTAGRRISQPVPVHLPAHHDHAWKRRTLALIEANPWQVTESSAQELFHAAAYPETITAAAGRLHRPARTRPRLPVSHAVPGPEPS